MRVLSWNLRDYLPPDASAAEIARCKRVPGVIRKVDPDVVAVQEVMCGAAQYQRLADELGMHCTVPVGNSAAVALYPGNRGRGVGLMWKPHVRPLPDTLILYDRARLNTGMVQVDLLVDHAVVTAAATHLAATGRYFRRDEAELVAKRLFAKGPNAFVGLDVNCISSAVGEDGEPYDKDPYAGMPWRESLISVCEWDESGQHRADRMPTEIMRRGGLYDIAAEIKVGHYDTAGHWKGDGIPRRIDAVWGTRNMVRAAKDSFAVSNRTTKHVSDHFPVVYDFTTARF